MSNVLSRLAPPAGSRPKERRLGRGPGSGVGKVSGRGMKGQKARQPGHLGKLHFQGGQTPLHRRLPKRGFNVPFPVRTVAINVSALERFEANAEVNEALLRSARLVQGPADRIKILGDGELSKALKVVAHGFSKSAREKIVAAGGQAIDAAPAAAAASEDASA
jgi:large subunit ribosomal protein L15